MTGSGRLRRLFRLATMTLAMLAPPADAQQPAPGAACGVCGGKTAVVCHRCRGTGAVDTPCRRCPTGDACPSCGSVPSKTGRVDCSNVFCRDGRVDVGGKKRLCKVCSGRGKQKCPRCLAARRCPCGGRPVSMTCPDCAGLGRIGCPSCTMTDLTGRCVLCGGKSDRACRRCPEAKGGKVRCRRCMGRGETPCPSCNAAGRVACGGCRGSGLARKIVAGGRKYETVTARCPACGGKGRAPCRSCERGRMDCEHCDRGKLEGVCGGCDGGRVTCGGCRDGAADGFLTQAHVLVDEEVYGRALEFLERGVERVAADIERLEAELAKPLPRRAPREKPAERIRRLETLRRLGRLKRTLARRRRTQEILEREIDEITPWLPRR